MVHQENGRFTDSSGNRIAWYGWQPKTDPVAVVQLSHGMCEYVERYQPLAEFLCRQGVAFYGHDHPGHGQSAAGWEELGYFRAKDGASLLVEDLRQMHLQLYKRFPELPIFLLGHSMGSFVARAYLSRYAEGLAGAVICGTSGGNPAAGLGKMLAELVVRVKGGHHRSRLLNQLAFGSYNKRFGNRTPYEWLTRDQEIVDRYAADPFCNTGIRKSWTGMQRILSAIISLPLRAFGICFRCWSRCPLRIGRGESLTICHCCSLPERRIQWEIMEKGWSR